ncbi:hypothetical protein [Carnobacterium maltaromaticum]|uniref:hypothetical protein n=1 Tax=Carnobacterium maltaromaticum TaxID=2751 RepID=UPI0005532BA8|nr:hypothetical protein [Carnobacterium maltaromaticum]KRN70224.1 hypothetical protein IV70_GL000010 [Carnobacterium maltaromaticum DSM 20342]
MKAYIVEDQYRNNQVLVYAVDALEARTAAKNTKELSHVEWIDLLVRRADYKDHLTAWEVRCFRLVIELNELVNGWSYEISNELMYEDNWKDFLNRLDSIERKNILAALDRLTEENGGNEMEYPLTKKV